MKATSAQQEILTELLDRYEHSVSYGQPAPWRREVILRLDRRTFPEAFSPDGRERRSALLGAARELERAGAVRLVREKRGPHLGEPKEIRLGPAEVEPAYNIARVFGYEPAELGLKEVARIARGLSGRDPMPDWLGAWLAALAAALEAGDAAPLAVSRDRFKREWRALPDALVASLALAAGELSGWERFASERLFGDSKRLGALRPWIVRVLVAADPRWEGVPPEEAFDLLEAYGLRRKPGLIRCAGAGALDVSGRSVRLEDFTPVAHLPDAWGASWVDAVSGSGVQTLTTIENEYPFLAYVEESGGPQGLGERREVAIYTAGFPTPALVAALAALGRRKPEIVFRHWGDADLGGLRIWLFLRKSLDHPIEIFRTTAEWVRAAADRDARRFSPLEVRALRQLRAQLERMTGSDVAPALALVEAMLDVGVKLEQERF
ncbi:MAG: hypothetical protein IT384_25475 [Deltaproteobacteria bacterium]|nr:hypothetical protein [Deltaproteobacteria bacterium]